MTEARVRRWRRSLRRPLVAVAGAALVLGALAAPSASAEPADDVRINEVVTTGDVNDSIELFNKSTATVDVSGWILKDDQNSSKYKIASGTTLAPGGFRAFDVHSAFGLGSDDQARLYFADGTTLVDSFSWSQHSNPSWSRCPDGTGSFHQAALTLGAANACGGSGQGTSPVAWPGSGTVSTADASNVFGEDLSGLYQEGGVLWAAQNSGKLWRLVSNGSGGWQPDAASGWSTGKPLHFPNGSGTPDDEAVTVTGSGSPAGVYVATERDGDKSGTSRLSVLRYDVSGTTTSLTAAKEWNLTAELPSVDANSGFEGLTWVPDSALTAAGFTDASTGAAYSPGSYGSHTGGVFFVGVEGTGMVYGYVLQDSGAFTRVAAFSTGMAGLMELQWEPQASHLWAVCDDTCSGQHRTFALSSGSFTLAAVYNRPSGMSNYNNEGFSVAPATECSGGAKPVYWSDDSNDGGHALRKGSISC
ncbi:lamin tail domain-containing protein [Amycolatopsis sp. FDAARGOS 1241]|uniref:lamin tail domain-containing protein n=1 Tax=Amycolatopsis sp. FDAARGOS 1241 TaxID=2778070 RepID=UPI0019505347|nr:lamin tail domain-containing protein [Amycolatopsis sp. FDAARGOS 1241]QRP43165.1 lamin tail domain-containing protein [Amycolatopsis sp. FDAARGOS 1241]